MGSRYPAIHRRHPRNGYIPWSRAPRNARSVVPRHTRAVVCPFVASHAVSVASARSDEKYFVVDDVFVCRNGFRTVREAEYGQNVRADGNGTGATTAMGWRESWNISRARDTNRRIEVRFLPHDLLDLRVFTYARTLLNRRLVRCVSGPKHLRPATSYPSPAQSPRPARILIHIRIPNHIPILARHALTVAPHHLHSLTRARAKSTRGRNRSRSPSPRRRSMWTFRQ